MLEMMLMSNRKPKIQYPNSGPGPKTLLFGDEQLGYFGELTSGSFLTVPELQRQLNFYAGTIVDPQVSWVKVFSEGAVLYIPKQPLTTALSWDALYQDGLVYGTDDVGTYPTTTPTNQLRVVMVEQRQLKVRLLKNSTIEPNAVVTWTDPNTQLAEWPKLAAAMISQVPTAAGMPSWNIYSNNTTLFAASSYVHSQNSAAATTQRIMTNTAVATGARNGSTSRPWFPVLELVPTEDEFILPVQPTYSLTQSMARPVVTLDPEHTYPLAVQRTSVRVQLNPAKMITTSIAYE